MQRIVKRYLLHKQREATEKSGTSATTSTSSDTGNTASCADLITELKRDVQLLRCEVTNARERATHATQQLHDGIVLLGEGIFSKSDNNHSAQTTAVRFDKYKQQKTAMTIASDLSTRNSKKTRELEGHTSNRYIYLYRKTCIDRPGP